MRPAVTALVVLSVVAGGLAGCFRPDAPPTAGAADSPPALPDGVAFGVGELLIATRDVQRYRWSGSLGGPAVDGISATDSSRSASLDLPGTVPLALTLTLHASTPADLVLALVDEYGFTRCRVDGRVEDALAAPGDALVCTDSEIAPLGWPRPWTVQVSAATARDVQVHFEVELEVRTRPGEVRAPVTPAGLAEIMPFEVTADDGTALRGHVYVPGGQTPFATILQFSPYWNSLPEKRSEGQAMDVAGRRTIAWSNAGHLGVLLDAGFAVALVNMRGTGESGGCNTFFEPVRDGKDAAVVIAALAAAPWSNGNVGMMGISWHGYSQYAAAAMNPPALKAVAPASAILDHWTLWTRYGAPLDLNQWVSGLPFYSLLTLINSGWLDGDGDPERLACPEAPAQALAFEAITETGDDAPFWEGRRMHDAIARADVPMLVSNGYSVPGEGHVLQAEGLWPLLPEGSVLMIGPWSHVYPEESGADRYLRLLVDWFDEHLRDGPQRVRPGVLYQDLDRRWHESDAWPPSSTPVDLYLTGSDLTRTRSDVATSEQALQSLDDNAPRPNTCPFWAVYATPPLLENVTLAGNFEVEVTVSSTEPDGNFAVFLWHADEVVACGEDVTGRVLGRALTDLRHRGHLRHGEPFPVGGEAVVAVRSHLLAVDVPAGQRLVVAIGGDSNSELRDKAFLPLITVRTGPDKAGVVRLPVVDGTLRFA